MKKHFLLLVGCGLAAAMMAQETQVPLSSLFGNLKGRHIGPAVTSGRISDVVGVDSKPSILYVGTAGGGVWKSVNAGASFEPIFDEYTQSIGKVTIDPKHPDTVWVGTGESWVRNSVSVGTGIYRSTNGGRTWEFKGLGSSEHIANVVVSPIDNKIVYVAATGKLWSDSKERGLYMSTDAGTTWKQVLYVNERTGCADISIDPVNPQVVYATMWEHRRYPDFFESGGSGSGVYKSSDGGKTWAKIQNGLPAGKLGRMAIAVAPSNPAVLYLTVECEKNEEKGLYKSTDAGATWKRMNGDFNTAVRPFYFSRLVVDPLNADKVYKCGLSLIMSKDGGTTFSVINSGVHSDTHGIWVNPKSTQNVYVGSDGGLYRSLDGGVTFEMMKNLPVGQLYHVAVDNEQPYNVYGGLQDNGSWYAPSESPGGINNADWQLSCWGDGFWSMPHPTDHNIVYSESQGGEVVRYNKKDGRTKDIKPIPTNGDPKYRFNWNTPISTSSHNPNRLFLGAQFLFMSDDRGDSWRKISPDLTTNDPKRQRQEESGGLSRDKSSAENNTTIYTIAESPKNANIVWVGTDDGNLQVSSDLGANWREVARYTGAPAFTWVSDVEASAHNPETAYVTFDGHRTGDMATYIFKTNDLGKNWESLVTPDIEGYAWCIKEDPINPSILYLGTEFGLYITIDGGQNWARFSNKFPKVAVHDIAIQKRDNAIVCATHGRGVIIIDNMAALRQMTPEVIAKDFHVFKTEPTIVRYMPYGEPFGGAGNFSGDNPDTDAKVLYYMKKRHTFGKMEIELYSPDGQFIKTFSAGKSAGLNMVNIPTNLPSPKTAPTRNAQALGSTVGGPTLPDGKYSAKIKKGKDEFTAEVEFAHEKISPYNASDRKAQFDLQLKIYNLLEKLGYHYYLLDDINKGIDGELAKTDEAGKQKLAALVAFNEEVRKFKNSVVALSGDFYIDSGEELHERLALLYGAVGRFPGKPTASQYAKAEEFVKEISAFADKALGLQKQLETYNASLTAAGLQAVKARTFEEWKAN